MTKLKQLVRAQAYTKGGQCDLKVIILSLFDEDEKSLY